MEGKKRIPVVAIVGWSGAGKTSFLEGLIPELKRRGYRVAAIKHSSHQKISFDTPGSDSWRLEKAGSDLVILATPRQLISIKRLERDLSLEEVLVGVCDVDIILVEGYKHEAVPKIEVTRGEISGGLVSRPDELIAIIGDRVEQDIECPQFKFEDIGGVADLLERGVLGKGKAAS